jgi:hypothetical protein
MKSKWAAVDINAELVTATSFPFFFDSAFLSQLHACEESGKMGLTIWILNMF